MQKDQVFFWSVLSFIIGVGYGSFFESSLGTILFLGLALWSMVFFVFPRQAIFFLGVFFLFFVGGAYLVEQNVAQIKRITFSSEETRGVARVVNDPEEKSFFQKVVVRFETCEEGTCTEKDILWQAPRTLSLQAGDLIRFGCKLKQPENFTPEFDYRMFLAKEGIGYVCEKGKVEGVLEQDRKGKIWSSIYAPKHALERALSQSIAEPEAGLAKGLLLGGDDYLPDSLKDSFRQVGLSHMVAVSGYNITLIAQGLLFLGLLCGLWRRQALWAAFCGIILFVIMIGAPPSGIRAGVMAGVAFGALQSGRLARPVNALFLAGALMLFMNPLLLRFDLGFQLSFLATLGIILAAPYQERFLNKDFWGKSIVEIFFLTLAVELFVLPIILFSFHTFSPLVLVGNLLIILVPYAMGFSFIAGLLFLTLPGLHVLPAWGAFFLLSGITHAVQWLGLWSGANIIVSSFGVKTLVLWYVILFGIVLAGKNYYSKKDSDEYGKEI